MTRTYLPVPATRIPADRIVYRKDDRLIVVPEDVAVQALVLEAPPLVARDGWAQMPTGPATEGRTVLSSPDRKLLYVLPLYPDRLTTVTQRVGSPQTGFYTEVWHWLPGDAAWERGESPDQPEQKEEPMLAAETTEITVALGPLCPEYFNDLDAETASDFEPDPALIDWASAQEWETIKVFGA